MGGAHLLNILNAHYFLIYPFYRWGDSWVHTSECWIQASHPLCQTLESVCKLQCCWSTDMGELFQSNGSNEGQSSLVWEEIAVLNGTLQGLSLTSLVPPSPLNPFSKIRHLQELRVRLSRKALQWYQGGLVICPHQSAHREVPTLLKGFWWPQDQHLLF